MYASAVRVKFQNIVWPCSGNFAESSSSFKWLWHSLSCIYLIYIHKPVCLMNKKTIHANTVSKRGSRGERVCVESKISKLALPFGFSCLVVGSKKKK
ncbi:hypothetical protein VNO77_20560 [Canavalia gladiata]|uniref:Uncharacterized protein n=1 Tax=Canavalia gladiata TaxID=3824 RepID=A0AAN9QLD1_CANGL